MNWESRFVIGLMLGVMLVALVVIGNLPYNKAYYPSRATNTSSGVYNMNDVYKSMYTMANLGAFNQVLNGYMAGEISNLQLTGALQAQYRINLNESRILEEIYNKIPATDPTKKDLLEIIGQAQKYRDSLDRIPFSYDNITSDEIRMLELMNRFSRKYKQ